MAPQVNSRQIAKHPLSHGDVISASAATPALRRRKPARHDDFERTDDPQAGPVRRGVSMPRSTRPPQPRLPPRERPPVSAAATPRACPLTSAPKPADGASCAWPAAPTPGKELELSKALTTIGKPGVQVAAITRRADGYYIVHVGGESGGAEAPGQRQPDGRPGAQADQQRRHRTGRHEDAVPAHQLKPGAVGPSDH